ncbi:MAG: spore germination protein, partial [Oscillospiraceae bacterium]|nr:spore germination protein [Oscillospiraceae bacterium]
MLKNNVENNLENLEKARLSPDLTTNLVNLRSLLNETSDLNVKYAKVADCDIAVITCEGMVNTAVIAELIYRPLNSLEHSKLTPDEFMSRLGEQILAAVSQNDFRTYGELARFFMSGFALILADGVDSGMAIAAQGFNTRSVEKPLIHSNMRGSCEGFTEALRTNISLVRRRLKSPNFVIKILQIGETSNTDVALCYMSNKADPNMLKQIEEKLEQIPVSLVLEGGFLEPFLQEGSNNFFTQVGTTDRP